MTAVAPTLRLPMIADDISETADVMRFVRDALHALTQVEDTTSAGAARGLYVILTEQISRLDVVVGEVTEAAVIVGGTAKIEPSLRDTPPRRNQ